MANWVRDFLAKNPDVAARQIVRRASHALHTRREDGKIEAFFTSAPMHYLDDHDQWQPLDTEPQFDGVCWRCPGLGVTIDPDGTVRLGKYSQLTRRVGLFRPSTLSLLGALDVSLGTKQGDALVAEGDWWRIERRITEVGYREWLTLKALPDVETRAGDYLVLETVVTGVSLPNGWVEDKYDIAAHWSPAPTAWAANGNEIACRRYWRDGVLYTGIPVEALAKATHPITIDPDFTGNTGDAYVYSYSTDYATARSTAYAHYSNVVYGYAGQYKYGADYYVYRSILKFDTSSIPDAATITGVTMRQTVYDDSPVDFDIQIVKCNWSAWDPISASNRTNCFQCVRDAALDAVWQNTIGLVVGTEYTSQALDTAWVSKTGFTYYGLRSSRDASATEPTGEERLAVYSADDSSHKPVLVVLYSEGAPPITGTGAVAARPAAVSANGKETFTATGAVAGQAVTLAATGGLGFSGTGAVAALAAAIAGTGSIETDEEETTERTPRGHFPKPPMSPGPFIWGGQ